MLNKWQIYQDQKNHEILSKKHNFFIGSEFEISHHFQKSQNQHTLTGFEKPKALIRNVGSQHFDILLYFSSNVCYHSIIQLCTYIGPPW